MRDMKTMLRCVLIGAAHMHILELAKYCAEHPNIEVTAVADTPLLLDEFDHGEPYTRSWNLEHVVRAYGVKRYESYTDMLDEERPDLALITTETAMHGEVFSACAQRKIAASIEKPMALDAAEGRRMVALAEETGTLLMVNWPIVWRPWFVQMRDLLRGGAIGDLVKLRYLAGHTGPLGSGARHRGVDETAAPMTDAQRAGTWWYHAGPGGGSAYDMLSYGTLVAGWMMPEPAQGVLGHRANIRHPYADIEDDAVAIVRYPKATAVLEGTWNSPSAAQLPGPELYGTEAMLRCRRKGEDVLVERIDYSGQSALYPVAEAGEGRKNIADAFVAYRAAGVALPELVCPRANLESMTLLDAYRQSVASGQWEKPVRP